MKTLLKSLPLFAAASLPVVAMLPFFGVDISAVLNFQTASAVFALLLIGQTGGNDYGRRMRRLGMQTRKTPARVRPETHRLAA